MNKKRVLTIIISILMLVITITIAYFLYTGQIAPILLPNQNSAENNNLNSDNSDISNPETNNIPGNNGNSNGGTDSGGGGSTGSQSQPSGSASCPQIQISYSIGRVVGNSICNSYENDICISKTINCSAEIRNLEENVGGIFNLEFIFYDSENIAQIIEKRAASVSLDSKEIETIYNVLTINNNNANKNISCDLNTVSVPKKSVC